MKRTRFLPLLLSAFVGCLFGFLIQLALAAAGQPVLTLPVTVSVTVVAAGVVGVLCAIPIFRSTRSLSARAINPFRAMRTVVFAKTCSVCGALIAGFSSGLVIYLMTRAVIPAQASILLNLAAALAGIVLVVAGLVAERLCIIPPDDPPKLPHSQGGEDNVV